MKPLLFLPLLAFGFLLAVFNWQLPKRQGTVSSPVPARASSGLLLSTFNQPIELDGYRLTWFNPRYEDDPDLQMSVFKFDAVIEKHDQNSQIQPVFNCDIVDGDVLVKEGVGVIFDDHHDFEAMVNQLTIIVPLEIDYNQTGQGFTLEDERLFPNRRVSACRYTPTGSYDPNLAVEIKF